MKVVGKLTHRKATRHIAVIGKEAFQTSYRVMKYSIIANMSENLYRPTRLQHTGTSPLSLPSPFIAKNGFLWHFKVAIIMFAILPVAAASGQLEFREYAEESNRRRRK